MWWNKSAISALLSYNLVKIFNLVKVEFKVLDSCIYEVFLSTDQMNLYDNNYVLCTIFLLFYDIIFFNWSQTKAVIEILKKTILHIKW